MKSLITTVIILAVVSGAAAGTKKAEPKPDLRLRVSTHSGPLPLALTLTGKLIGVNLSQMKSCVIKAESTEITPAGLRFDRRDEIPCVNDSEIPDSFEKELTLTEPGTYSYRIILVPKEGKTIISRSQEVKVHRGRIQAGVTATGSGSFF